MAHIITSNGEIVITARLTKAGRQKLAAGLDAFKVTKFAVADDQIDYSLPGLQAQIADHPETFPILQPVLNGNLMMKNKLYTDYNINSGARILANIDITGLKVGTSNLINGTINGQTTYSPSTNGKLSKQLYIIDLNFVNGVPFSNIQAVQNNNSNIKTQILATGQTQYTIPNANSITFFNGTNVSSTVYFTMTVTGMSTGAHAVYQFKYIPSSVLYTDTIGVTV